MTNAARGFRGYIGSRPVRGVSFPQRVQNLVVRDFAQRHGLHYLLSATEYAMPSCYMMLASVLDELPKLDGVIAFSAFMLPKRKERRLAVYERILSQGKVLCAALEDLAIRSQADADRLEDMIDVVTALPASPFAGRYEKDEDWELRSDPFAQVILSS